MQKGHYRGHLKSLLAVACGFLLAGDASAVNWEGSLLFSPSIVYTDNVCLSKDDKRDDFTGVAVLTPSGAVSMETSRTKASVSGSLSVNTLTNGDLRDDGCTGNALNDRQQYFPRIFARLNTTLIGDWLKFDANIRADQNRVSSALAESNDGLNRNGNTNTFYRYSLSPYTSRKLGPRHSVNARYTYSQVINTVDDVSDSERHALTSSVNGKVGNSLGWNLRGNYSLTSYSDDAVNFQTNQTIPREDTELRSMSARVNYKVLRTLKVDGSYGWEWNDFQTFSNRDTGGGAWDVGLTWTPSPRTTVSIGTGERFFGSTPRANFRQEYKNHTISGTYRKTVTFQRDLATYGLDTFGDGSGGGSQFSDPLFGGGDTRFDGSGNPVDGIGTNTSVNSNSAILDERFTFRYAYSGRPGVLTFFGSYSQQTRAEDGAQADFGDWELTFEPDLSKRYSLVGSISYEEIQPVGFIQFSDSDNPRDFNDVENWVYMIRFIRPLNSRMNAMLEYRFTDRVSDDSINEYNENLLRATLNIAL